MKIFNIIICFLVFSLVSCDDFLDVRPKAEKLERELFKNAQGYEDAIYGVYGSLQQRSLYGKDLTWGVPEVLAQNLYSSDPSVEKLAKYDYKSNEDLRTRLSNIWSCAYTSIGYANNILEQLNSKSPSSLPLYNYYKGEMLGIRALLHFDLLRLFASTDTEKQGIPYVTKYSYGVKPFYKVGEVYQFIIKDLLEAEELLSGDEDRIKYPHVNKDINAFLNYRETHFNIYAVRALLARLYWMKGDMTNAGKYAKSVIDSNVFPLVNETEIKDYLAGTLSPKETIFGVYSTSYISTCESYLYKFQSFHSYNPYYDGSGSTNPMSYDKIYRQDISSTTQDFRRDHFKVGAGIVTCLKLVDYYTLDKNVQKARESLISGITLIHSSELYLIAAEAYLKSNYNLALKYFNDEIESRGLTPLTMNETLTNERIYNEYRKELFCEGQMWYNMKRLNKDIVSNMENRIIPANDNIYVIPIPEEEFEYRNE